MIPDWRNCLSVTSLLAELGATEDGLDSAVGLVSGEHLRAQGFVTSRGNQGPAAGLECRGWVCTEPSGDTIRLHFSEASFLSWSRGSSS